MAKPFFKALSKKVEIIADPAPLTCSCSDSLTAARMLQGLVIRELRDRWSLSWQATPIA